MCTWRALLHYFNTFGTLGVNWVINPWCECSCDLFLCTHTVLILLYVWIIWLRVHAKMSGLENVRSLKSSKNNIKIRKRQRKTVRWTFLTFLCQFYDILTRFLISFQFQRLLVSVMDSLLAVRDPLSAFVIDRWVDRKWVDQPEVDRKWYNQEEDEVVSYQVVNQVPILMKDESPVQSEAKDFFYWTLYSSGG